MSIKVSQVLQSKPAQIYHLRPEDSVFEALTIMAKNNISGVLVMDGAKLVGIFTERDYARKVALHGKHSREINVGTLMTTQLLIVSPEHTIEQVMETMTERRVRHLPVLEEGALVGLITIGDVVKTLIDEQRRTISHLSSYIAGDIAS